MHAGSGLRVGSALRVGFVPRVAVVAAFVVACAGCSLVDRDEEVDQVSVFDVAVGDCFRAPQDIEQELTELSRVDCAEPHEQELYALAAYDEAGRLVCRSCISMNVVAQANRTIEEKDPTSTRNLWLGAAGSVLVGLATCLFAGAGLFFLLAPVAIITGGAGGIGWGSALAVPAATSGPAMRPPATAAPAISFLTFMVRDPVL